MNGRSNESFSKSLYGESLENWSYRNMWWHNGNEPGAFAARGVHGQTIYIDPKAEMVIVRFASHLKAKNSKLIQLACQLIKILQKTFRIINLNNLRDLNF